MLKTIVKTDSYSNKTIIHKHVKPVLHVNKQENVEDLVVNILCATTLKTCPKPRIMTP